MGLNVCSNGSWKQDRWTPFHFNQGLSRFPPAQHLCSCVFPVSLRGSLFKHKSHRKWLGTKWISGDMAGSSWSFLTALTVGGLTSFSTWSCSLFNIPVTGILQHPESHKINLATSQNLFQDCSAQVFRMSMREKNIFYSKGKSLLSRRLSSWLHLQPVRLEDFTCQTIAFSTLSSWPMAQDLWVIPQYPVFLAWKAGSKLLLLSSFFFRGDCIIS